MAARTRTPARRPAPAKPATTKTTTAAAFPAPRDETADQAGADALLATARTEADQLRTTAQADADQLLAEACQKLGDAEGFRALAAETAVAAGRDAATAEQWAAEAEQLRADAAADAEVLTLRAEQTVRQILDLANDQADLIRQDTAQVAQERREEADAAAHAEADRLLEEATERAGALLADAEQRAATVRSKAEGDAARIVADAEEQARRVAAGITALAQEQAAKVVGEAEREVEATLRRAAGDLADVQEQVDDVRHQLERTREKAAADRALAERDLTGARELAATVQRDAATAADRTLTEATTEAEAIRSRAADTAREILRAAAEQAEETRTEADATAGRVTEAARVEADTVREDAAVAARQLRDDAEAEAHELREEAAQQAADLRERGQKAVQRQREDAQAAIDEAKRAAGEQLRQASAVRGKAESDSQRLLNTARKEAEQVTADALAELAETEQHVAELRAEQRQLEQKRADRQTGRLRRAWRWWEANIPKLLPKLALWAGVAYTAAGEHHLAVMAGIDDVLAWLFPVAVDVWVVAATRAHAKAHTEEERERITWEVVTALVVMMACQIASLLAELHIFGVEPRDGEWRVKWGLAVPLAMVVPVVIWRVHALMGHGPSAHGKPADDATAPVAPAAQPDGVHEDPTPRPPHGGQPLPTAHGDLPSAQGTHGERSSEREIVAGGGTSDAHRALPPAHPQDADAHPAPAMSDAALLYARKALVRSLYDVLGRRPRASEIHAVLTAKGLLSGDERKTRSTCQRVRDAVEDAEPALKPSVRSA
ncbi:hypothetical protein ACFVXG_38315 [Kitasatospora sp. NPDC058162]|uniref:hypothetical protein n=1 Tax=Kitasatospora sp. NPDC058162 TaxID=3346362 RepID=UPI0036D8E714